MKIKQQNQIKTFLIEEFGVDSGNALFEKQEKILNEIIKNTKNKSKKSRQIENENLSGQMVLNL